MALNDMFICGLSNVKIQEKLFEQVDKSFNEVVDRALGQEVLMQQSRLMNDRTYAAEINRVYSKKENKSQKSDKNENTYQKKGENKKKKSFQCMRCGNSYHKNNKCPADGVKCNKCHKNNHFPKMCKTKKQDNKEEVNTIASLMDEIDSRRVIAENKLNNELVSVEIGFGASICNIEYL